MRPSATPEGPRTPGSRPPRPSDGAAPTAVLLAADDTVLSGTPDTAWLYGSRLCLAADSGTLVLDLPEGPTEFRYTAQVLGDTPGQTAAGPTRLVLLARTDVPTADAAHRRGLRHARLAREAAVGIAGSLDFRVIAERLVHVLVPAFADIATVDVPEAVLRTDDAAAEDLTEQRLHRIAIATADGSVPPPLTPAGGLLPLLHKMPDVGPLRPGGVLVSGDIAGFRAALGLPDADLPRLVPDTAHALVAAAMSAGNRTVGVLSAWRTGTPGAFADDEADLFAEIASRAALGLDNARRYAREHRTAVALQRSLLPPRVTRAPAAETAGTYVPAEGEAGVGGDWYDVVPLSSLRTAFVVGDVAGHGLGATAAMGRLRTAVETLADLDPEPGELLAHLDDLIANRSDRDHDRPAGPVGDEAWGDAELDVTAHGSTALYAVYDPIRGTCTMAGAGHPPPVVLYPETAPEFVDLVPGPPLGIGGFPFEEAVIHVPPGTLLAFYTDGLVDPAGPAGSDGMAELAAALDLFRDLPIADVGPAVLERIAPSRRDDVALLLVRTLAVPAGAVVEWELPAEPSVVGRARELAGGALAAWGLGDLAFTTELVVSELVTNAIRYGGGPVGLRLIRDHALICEVSDPSNTQPRLRRARDGDEGGRGLFLVAQLTSRWGSRYRRSGKTIWAEQSLDPQAGDVLPDLFDLGSTGFDDLANS